MKRRRPAIAASTRVEPSPVTVACVLRSGGVYDARWVLALKAQVERHLPVPHRFVCLSDMPVPGVEVILLTQDWPGWWSKVELFRPDLFDGQAVYLDLDTLAIGDLSDLAGYEGDFALLRNWNRPEGYGSGVMLWRPSSDSARIFLDFAVDPAGHMERHRSDGDQGWIGEVIGTGDDIGRLQDLFPGQVASYKIDHCHTQAPAGTRLVAFHGRPKPNNCGGWAQVAWEAAVQGAA